MAQTNTCRLEFFPPKTKAGQETLVNSTLSALSVLNPKYISVTYGASGSTRNTVSTVGQLQATKQDVVPHLSFRADDEDSMPTLLERYRDMGVTRLVALRGDSPSGMGGSSFGIC